MKSEDERTSSKEVVGKYIGLILAIAYILVGIAIIFFPTNELFVLSSSNSLILGIIFILYGAFRGFRTYQKRFKEDSNSGINALVILFLLASCTSKDKSGNPLDTPTAGSIKIAIDESLQPLMEAKPSFLLPDSKELPINFQLFYTHNPNG